MRVNHRRIHVVMAEQLLDRANVLPAFEPMGRKRVSQRVCTDRLGDLRAGRRPLDTRAQRSFVQVMPGRIPLRGSTDS